MRISDWSSDVCSSDLRARRHPCALSARPPSTLQGPGNDRLSGGGFRDAPVWQASGDVRVAQRRDPASRPQEVSPPKSERDQPEKIGDADHEDRRDDDTLAPAPKPAFLAALLLALDHRSIHRVAPPPARLRAGLVEDRKSTRLNSSH